MMLSPQALTLSINPLSFPSFLRLRVEDGVTYKLETSRSDPNPLVLKKQEAATVNFLGGTAKLEDITLQDKISEKNRYQRDSPPSDL